MIAFMVIAEIQYYYAKSLQNDAIKARCKQAELEVKEEIGNSSFGATDWLFYVLYRVIKTFYDCIYYYFLPFSIVLITFITSKAAALKEAEIEAGLRQAEMADDTDGNVLYSNSSTIIPHIIANVTNLL